MSIESWIRRMVLLAVVVCVDASAVAAASEMTPAEAPVVMRLDTGWQARFGDSPRDAGGAFEWLRDPAGAPGWMAMEGFQTPGGNTGNYLWVRRQLPEFGWRHPAIFLPSMMFAIEAYVDTEKVYTFGTFESPGNAHAVTAQHLISGRQDWSGKTLSIRVYSHLPQYIGYMDVSGAPEIGEGRDLVMSLVRASLEQTLVGLFSIFVGILSLFVFLRRLQEHRIFPLSFGLFAIFNGLFYVFMGPLALLVVGSLPVVYYGQSLSFLLFPVWLYVSMERVTRERVFRVVWVVHAVFASALIVMDIFGFMAIARAIPLASMLLIVTIIVAIVVAVRAAKLGRRGARLLIFGFVVAGVLGLMDTVQGLRLIPHVHWMSHWGTLTLTLVLLFTLERRFAEDHRMLKVYSRELEAKSAQLEVYAHTLEDKVTERTRDLDGKNRELVRTLDELQSAQEQLIMSEKMASLGNLVAGVAHEVNNPVGAISSAADVSDRALGILNEQLEGDDSAKSDRVKKALDVLNQNNTIVGTAARRVTEIVKSLRTFSRLDEAVYQEADLREGLDSTLTLLHHETKRRIDVVREYGDIPRIRCYPNELNQVFMNILMNAIHAIDGEGRITIGTRHDSENVYVSIADTGRGIEEFNLRRVFDPGFTTKGVGVGTGLGLSITYKIVKKHHGAIRVESEVGKGTTFLVSLPIRAIEISS